MAEAAPSQADAFDQVQWIIETIAERNYPVSEDGTWAGRTMLVTHTANHFSIPDDVASGLVDQAVARLFDRKADAAPQVHVRLLVAKIDRHERVIMDLLTKPREKIEYELSPRMDENSCYMHDGDGNILYDKIPTKATSAMEVPVALHRYLIDLYKLRAYVLSIRKGGDDMKRAAQLIETLLSRDPTAEIETTLSVSQKVKQMDKATLDAKRPRRISSKTTTMKVLPAKPASASSENGNGNVVTTPAAAPGPMPDGESRPIA